MQSYLDLPEFWDIRDNVLVEYLNPLDILKITDSSSTFEKCLIYHINERLKKIFGDKYLQFKSILSKFNLAISGSFVLQCILGIEWEASDLDIVQDIGRDYTEGDLHLFDKDLEKYSEFFGEILKTNDTSTVDEWYSYLNNFDISLITNYTTKNNSTTKEINNIQVIGYEQSKLYGEVQISSVP